jgi:hypothetical protein
MTRIDLLPTVLLGLRTCIKGNIKASAAELFYSRPLSLPAEFVENEYIPADPQRFVEKKRHLRPKSTAHHIKPRIFILKDLYTSSHVFLRTNAMKSPLQPP